MKRNDRGMWRGAALALAGAALLAAGLLGGCREAGGEAGGVYDAIELVPEKEDPAPAMPKDLLRGLGPEDGPGKIALDELADLFGPTPFDHRAHAAMAQMGEDKCGLCHHHARTGKVEACGACHKAPLREGKASLLGLKGAYHNQCFSCHRNLGSGLDCGACHRGRDGEAGPEHKGGFGKRLVMPEVRTYATEAYGEGSEVVFDHENHKDAWEGGCAACHGHAEAGCAACHGPEAKDAKPPETDPDEPHERCFACHGPEAELAFGCEDCHGD